MTVRRGTALAAALAAALLAGCATRSPYDRIENWLIREDAARTFAIPADVFYVQPGLYDSVAKVPHLFDYAKHEVGGGRFKGLARVFSPLVATREDVADAVEWYLRLHHRKGRPFVFIGEGEGGMLLQEYSVLNAERLREEGLVYEKYGDSDGRGLVKDETVAAVRIAVGQCLYREEWGREMPEGMIPQ